MFAGGELAVTEFDGLLVDVVAVLFPLETLFVGDDVVQCLEVEGVDIGTFYDAEALFLEAGDGDVPGDGFGVLDGSHVRGRERGVKDGVEEIQTREARVVAGELVDADLDVEGVADLLRHFTVSETAEPGMDLAELVLREVLEWFRDDEFTVFHGSDWLKVEGLKLKENWNHGGTETRR